MKIMKKFCKMHDPKSNARKDEVAKWCNKQCDNVECVKLGFENKHEYEIK
jgi:Zn ribbon nucleic-acid-binding protein